MSSGRYRWGLGRRQRLTSFESLPEASVRLTYLQTLLIAFDQANIFPNHFPRIIPPQITYHWPLADKGSLIDEARSYNLY
jgi:hypothetical protein